MSEDFVSLNEMPESEEDLVGDAIDELTKDLEEE